jgi:hypothetical protein
VSSQPSASAASATGSFHRDLPRHWLTTAYSLMHAAAKDVAVSHVSADDAAGLTTVTCLPLSPRPPNVTSQE